MTKGYFDIQVNGYMGIDFHKDSLTAAELHQVCERLKSDGVDMILATITTEAVDQMAVHLAKILKFRESDKLVADMIPGFHIEGPFLNEQPGYRGAHPADAIHPADVDEMRRLLDAAGGLAKLVTLAPERDDGLKVTRMLADQGVRVAAGHCNPSLDQLQAAIDAGLTHFTHLGNGCPMEMHRHDNIIQRAISLHDKLWLCFIADGAHIAFPALGNYLRACDMDHVIVTTDAISAAGMGPGRYRMNRWDLVVGEDLVARAPDGSHLVGSACIMSKMAENLVEKVGLTQDQVQMLTVINPRNSFGME